jgi:hypothetical protein
VRIACPLRWLHLWLASAKKCAHRCTFHRNVQMQTRKSPQASALTRCEHSHTRVSPSHSPHNLELMNMVCRPLPAAKVSAHHCQPTDDGLPNSCTFPLVWEPPARCDTLGHFFRHDIVATDTHTPGCSADGMCRRWPPRARPLPRINLGQPTQRNTIPTG